MSEPLKDEAEVLDGLPVLSDKPQPADVSVASVHDKQLVLLAAPVQTAAVAAGGFLAGAAVWGLARRRHGTRTSIARMPNNGRRTRRVGRRRSKSVGGVMEVLATRTFLVDVHLLGSASSRNR